VRIEASTAAAAAWPAAYLALPFAPRGRDHSGCDCFGLVRLVLAEQCGIVLSPRGDLSAGWLSRLAAGASPLDIVPDEWRPVGFDRLAEFDVITMTGAPFHIGVVTPCGRVLHTEAGHDCVVMPLDHPFIAGRKLGAFRHRSL
jgi:hypothetical protein